MTIPLLFLEKIVIMSGDISMLDNFFHTCYIKSYNSYLINRNKGERYMRLIDFHTHIYPEQITEKATESICDFYHLETDLNGTADVLLKCGREAGIEKFVLLPVAIRPEHTRHINQFIVQETQIHSEFYGFGTLHAELEDWEGELAYIEDAGLRGIKLHPDTQQFPIDDERLFPVYDALQDRLPVLIHCGNKRYDYSSPARLLRVIREFPRLRIIAAHLGGWLVFEEAFTLLRDADCYFDISSCMRFLTPRQMKRYIEGYGAQRVLFGSDFPLWDPKEEVRAFENLDLSREDRERIAYGNACEILGIF